MKIAERRVYRGPSQYALFPVMRLTVDLGELEAWPTGKLDGFNQRLLAALPTLDAHTCSYGVAGGFVRRLTEQDGTWLGHVMEHVAIELAAARGREGQLRQDAQRGRARPLSRDLRVRRGARRRGRGGSRASLARVVVAAGAAEERARGLRLQERARGSDHSRAAPPARPVDELARAAPPKRATSRGCGSTTTPRCSSATASTRSGSRRR